MGMKWEFHFFHGKLSNHKNMNSGKRKKKQKIKKPSRFLFVEASCLSKFKLLDENISKLIPRNSRLRT